MGEQTTVWTSNTLTKASITESSIQLLSYSSVSLVCVCACGRAYALPHSWKSRYQRGVARCASRHRCCPDEYSDPQPAP